MTTTLELPTVKIPRSSSAITVRKPSLDDGLGSMEQQRVVLVSPFDSFNMMFEYVLKEISKDIELDVVDIAKLPNTPYIDVNERERQKESVPSLIVDFLRIGVATPEGRKMGTFSGYWNWNAATIDTAGDIRTRYFIPRPDAELGMRSATYEVGKIFDPCSFRTSDLTDLLKQDLRQALVQGSANLPYLFGEQAAGE